MCKFIAIVSSIVGHVSSKDVLLRRKIGLPPIFNNSQQKIKPFSTPEKDWWEELSFGYEAS
jgi:hypothetical protein